MKTDLRDTAFLIPVRTDSVVRLENLMLSVNFLHKHFNTHITVLEATNYPNGIVKKMLGKKAEYLFIEDKDPVFYRTKYLNFMTRRSCTSYVGIWDADVIIPKEQLIVSVEKLRQGFDIAYPYDGHFYDTTHIIREQYVQNKSMFFLLKNKYKMHLIYGNKMKGGAVLVNKEAYIKAGMENEKFYGWGPEDFERFERWEILDYKIYRSEGPLFHLTHTRGTNSGYRSIEQSFHTIREWETTKQSSKTELLRDLL